MPRNVDAPPAAHPKPPAVQPNPNTSVSSVPEVPQYLDEPVPIGQARLFTIQHRYGPRRVHVVVSSLLDLRREAREQFNIEGRIRVATTDGVEVSSTEVLRYLKARQLLFVYSDEE